MDIFQNILRADYDFLAGKFVEVHHDVVMFTLKKMKWKLDSTSLERNTMRSVLRARGEYAGQHVVCTTAHMQSEFFNLKATQIKAVQMLQISQLLRDIPATIKFHIGDTNLTGGDQLEKENRAIQQAGLVDMWARLTPSFDSSENQSDPIYQTRDATWRSPENTVIKELQGVAYYEHHRPDRVLMTSDSLAKVNQADTKITLLRENWSDHDGLLLQLSLETWTGSEVVVLEDEGGISQNFECNAKPGGVFKYPVFFHKGAKVSSQQKIASPVLLLSADDWQHISDPKVTHTEFEIEHQRSPKVIDTRK